MNTPVSFSIAKLLKEKGFDKPTHSFYVIDESEYGEIGEFITNPNDNYPTLDDNGMFDTLASAPIIAEVVMWLYDNHKIYIHISPHGEEEDLLEDCKWWFSVYKNKLYNLVGGSKVTKDIEDFGSLTEAYEAAIEYALNNLV